MIKNQISAFLYSNKNYELAYTLKKYCIQKNINIINVIDLSEIFGNKATKYIPIIFVDAKKFVGSYDLLALIAKLTPSYFKFVVFFNLNRLEAEKYSDGKYIFCIEHDCEIYEKLPNLLNKICCGIDFDSNAFVSEAIKKDWSSKICELLISFNFSPRQIGFSILKDAILYCFTNDCVIKNLSAEVYVFLSIKYKTTIKNIEKHISRTIEKSWHNNKALQLIFKKCPTNKEFIVSASNKFAAELC